MNALLVLPAKNHSEYFCIRLMIFFRPARRNAFHFKRIVRDKRPEMSDLLVLREKMHSLYICIQLIHFFPAALRNASNSRSFVYGALAVGEQYGFGTMVGECYGNQDKTISIRGRFVLLLNQ